MTQGMLETNHINRLVNDMRDLTERRAIISSSILQKREEIKIFNKGMNSVANKKVSNAIVFLRDQKHMTFQAIADAFDLHISAVFRRYKYYRTRIK